MNSAQQPRGGFTLVELLVGVVVISVLMGILLPSIAGSRRQAWVSRARHDLRQIGLAAQVYCDDYRFYPPARTFCASMMKSIEDYNHLPPELVGEGYLSEALEDVFNPGHTYKYIAPGYGWANGKATCLAIWVPRAFPGDGGPQDDKAYFSQRASPVPFATWSMGPAGPKSVFESDMLHYPVPPRHWYPNKRDGIIVYLMAEGGPRASP